jgi:hypothetical protein
MWLGIVRLPVSPGLQWECYKLYYAYVTVTGATMLLLEIQLQRMLAHEMGKGWFHVLQSVAGWLWLKSWFACVCFCCKERRLCRLSLAEKEKASGDDSDGAEDENDAMFDDVAKKNTAYQSVHVKVLKSYVSTDQKKLKAALGKK